MWTAILATLNLLHGTSYDVWSVNTEADYLEERQAADGAVADDPLSLLEALRPASEFRNVGSPHPTARSPR
jgi:hypothetical protein